MSEKGSAWSEYLAAAQRLDALQRDAAEAAAAEANAVAAARTELPALRARLGMQAGRLLETATRAGAPPPVLTPGAADQRAAAGSVVGGPAVALAALRQARQGVDVADEALTRVGEGTGGGQALKNMLVYGPLALLVMVVQLWLAIVTDERARLFYATACGMTLAVMAFGLGWLLVGLVFRGRPRTAAIGALAIFTPPVLITLTLALLPT